MDWFLYDNGLRHERVEGLIVKYCTSQLYSLKTYPCNFSVNQIVPISVAAIQLESIFLFSQVKLVPSKLRENYLRISL